MSSTIKLTWFSLCWRGSSRWSGPAKVCPRDKKSRTGVSLAQSKREGRFQNSRRGPNSISGWPICNQGTCLERRMLLMAGDIPQQSDAQVARQSFIRLKPKSSFKNCIEMKKHLSKSMRESLKKTSKLLKN